MTRPRLYIFAGLPGSGKSTLAELLARRLRAAYVRIDTIEQALRDLCSIDVQGEGYRLGYRVAADNLRVGIDVVADSCNPINLTRLEWERTAMDIGADYVNVEVVCSNLREHRTRVETRRNTVPGLRLPTWEEVSARPYEQWAGTRVILDTFGRSPEKCVDELLAAAPSEA
jgi:predicted kinase